MDFINVRYKEAKEKRLTLFRTQCWFFLLLLGMLMDSILLKSMGVSFIYGRFLVWIFVIIWVQIWWWFYVSMVGYMKVYGWVLFKINCSQYPSICVHINACTKEHIDLLACMGVRIGMYGPKKKPHSVFFAIESYAKHNLKRPIPEETKYCYKKKKNYGTATRERIHIERDDEWTLQQPP